MLAEPLVLTLIVFGFAVVLAEGEEPLEAFVFTSTFAPDCLLLSVTLIDTSGFVVVVVVLLAAGAAFEVVFGLAAAGFKVVFGLAAGAFEVPFG